MKRILAAIAAFFMALTLAPAVCAQTACANPEQALPNFSGNGPGAGGAYTIAAGASLPVNWTPSATPGCVTYYTTNGQPPTSSSPVYTGQTFQLTQTTVILMIAEGPGMTNSQQEGGQWVINVAASCLVPPSAGETCGAGNAGPCVILSCSPSSAANSTVTMFRSQGESTAFSQIAAGLPSNCAYTDLAVTAGQTYTYYAEAVANGETSAPSNSCSVTIPAPPPPPTLATPTVAIVFAPATATSATAVVATVTVSGTAATATGSVTLTSGAFSSAAGTLSNGSVSITIPANSLDVGSISITATYTPDTASSTVYNSGTTTAMIVITPTAPSALSAAEVQSE